MRSSYKSTIRSPRSSPRSSPRPSSKSRYSPRPSSKSRYSPRPKSRYSPRPRPRSSTNKTYRAPLSTRGRTVGKTRRTKKYSRALHCQNWFGIKPKIKQYECLMNDDNILNYLQTDYLSSENYHTNRKVLNAFLKQFESMFEKESLEKQRRLLDLLTLLQEDANPASNNWLIMAIKASNKLKSKK